MPISPSESGPGQPSRRVLTVVLARLIPRSLATRIAALLLSLVHSDASPNTPPSTVVLETCASELLRSVQARHYAPLVQALLKAADRLPPLSQVSTLEALVIAIRDAAFERRFRTFSQEAPNLARVEFAFDWHLGVREPGSKRITRYVLFDTHRETLVISDQQLDTLTTAPNEEHQQLLERVRTVSGSALPDLDALETWIDALAGLCFAHYDSSGDSRLDLREYARSSR